MSTITEARPLWRRLLWFAALWSAGVIVLAAVSAVLRLALHT